MCVSLCTLGEVAQGKLHGVESIGGEYYGVCVLSSSLIDFQVRLRLFFMCTGILAIEEMRAISLCCCLLPSGQPFPLPKVCMWTQGPISENIEELSAQLLPTTLPFPLPSTPFTGSASSSAATNTTSVGSCTMWSSIPRLIPYSCPNLANASYHAPLRRFVLICFLSLYPSLSLSPSLSLCLCVSLPLSPCPSVCTSSVVRSLSLLEYHFYKLPLSLPPAPLMCRERLARKHLNKSNEHHANTMFHPLFITVAPCH